MVRGLWSKGVQKLAYSYFTPDWWNKFYEDKYLLYRSYRSVNISYRTGRKYKETPSKVLIYYNDLITKPSEDTINHARHFFRNLLKDLPNDFIGEELKVKRLAAWVNNHAVYVRDSDRWGSLEYWSSPFDLWAEYLETGSFKDDCDGWAVLLWWACTLVGISEERVFVWAGDVKDNAGGVFGHANVVYDPIVKPGMFHVEGSFYPRDNQRRWLSFRWKNSSRYVRTWFMFNSQRTIR